VRFSRSRRPVTLQFVAPDPARVIRQADWRMNFSPAGADALATAAGEDLRRTGRAPDMAAVAGMAETSLGALSAHRATQLMAPLSVQAHLRARVQDLVSEAARLGANPGREIAVPKDVLPRTRVWVALAITVVIAFVCALVAGLFFNDFATSTTVAALGSIAAGAVVGAVAGDALTRVRTRWTVAAAIGALAMTAAAGLLVTWSLGFGLSRQLLQVALVLVAGLVAAGVWAMAAVSRGPLLIDRRTAKQRRCLKHLAEARTDLAQSESGVGAIVAAYDGAVMELRGIVRRAAEAYTEAALRGAAPAQTAVAEVAMVKQADALVAKMRLDPNPT